MPCYAEEMKTPQRSSRTILKWLLLAGAIYFLLVALAHQLQFKIPGLYIYWDVPSFAYQDIIISALAFGWAAFFALGAILVSAGSVSAVALHVGAGLVAWVSLVRVNMTGELRVFVDDFTRPYWIQVGALGFYLALVAAFYVRAVRDTTRGEHGSEDGEG
jgi:hypothetical protein